MNWLLHDDRLIEFGAKERERELTMRGRGLVDEESDVLESASTNDRVRVRLHRRHQLQTRRKNE